MGIMLAPVSVQPEKASNRASIQVTPATRKGMVAIKEMIVQAKAMAMAP